MPSPIPRAQIPSALDAFSGIDEIIGSRTPAIFLDYDGTLTPIVAHPDLAVLTDEGRAVVERLARLTPVAVISGRDTADVRGKIAVPGLVYAGSHGFDIQGLDGSDEDRFAEFLEPLIDASDELETAIAGIDGAHVERKRFAVAVHFRQVASADDERRVEEAFHQVAAGWPQLKATGGKKIFELRPDVPWDKGRALQHVLERMDLGGDVVPMYLGDDVTDEDAFRVLVDDGLGIVVGTDGAPSLDRIAGLLADR
jgi:trehalose 6-phosphate phosphatase